MRTTEKLLLYADESPFGCLFRTVVGFAALPVLYSFCGNDASVWSLLLFLVSVLFGLRIVPAIVRRVFPFSSEIREVWARRRQLAKCYDSYQWRKLFWIGSGLAGYLVLFGDFRTSNVILALGCLLAGGAGWWSWRRLRIDETKTST